MLAENARGKTTLVDGLELWSSGDLKHYHREGYELDCVVNLDSQRASVTAETNAHPPLTRTLADGKVSDLQPAGPMAVGTKPPPPLPILRHRTMAEFMDMSPGEKKKVLLEFFGLSALTDFRQTLRTACNAATQAATEDRRRAKGERSALEALLDGRDLVELADELRADARLAGKIAGEHDLLKLEVEQTSRHAEPDRPALVAAVAKAIVEAEDDATARWNEAVADRETAAAQSVSALLAAGQRVLEDWDEATCPLCHQPKDRDELLRELRARAGQLREADERARLVGEALEEYRSRLASLETALGKLVEAEPPSGWPVASKLIAARETLQRQVAAVAEARRERKACPPNPALDLPDLSTLKAAAQTAAADERAPQALASLVRVQEQLRRLRKAEARVDAASSVAKAVAALLEITDDEIRQTMEDTIGRIGKLAAGYYGRLVSTPVYSDVKLEYRTGRAGGIEFSLVFDGRHPVSPPQRVMSESQLNALGLALFLARLQVDEQPWRTLVLDDVVNSFDGAHRLSLARLLADEFADWQVILVTHDRIFATLARKFLQGWRFSEIAVWTPTGGPIFVEGSTREQLRTRLDEGRSASELGGLARVALEQGLSLPLEKLGLEIRYDPHGRYSAHELLVALRRGLRDRKSTLAKLPVLAQMEADSYLVNLSAHDRPADPALTTEDLRRLVDDLDELEESFVCTACGEHAWHAATDHGRHHQCRCSALAV